MADIDAIQKRSDEATRAVEWTLIDAAAVDAVCDSAADVPALLARVRELEAAVQREMYAAWDDGNGCGLDGWVGPERGTEPDDYAIRARDRYVEKRLAALRGSDV